MRIQIEEGKAGLFYATSQDLKGLLVANETLDGLKKEISKTIAALLEARGDKMVAPVPNTLGLPL